MWRIYRRGNLNRTKWYLAHYAEIAGVRNPKWIMLDNLVYQVPMEFKARAEAEATIFELVTLKPERIGQIELERVPRGKR